jgi:hypothetical protein
MTDGSLFDRTLRLLARAACVLVFLHVLGWVLVVTKLGGASTLYVPPIQAAIGLGLSLLVVRVAGARRGVRRTVAVSVLIVTAVAFLTVPLPVRFVDNTLMVDGIERVEDRDLFERRFPLADGQINFHSHLGDIAIISLDRFFGASETSQQQAFNALSHLAGLLFLVELLLVGMLYRWSRRVCRYIGLAIGTPMASLYFGYWELGYIAVAVAVVPFLLFPPNRRGVSTQASAMAAGALQGLHTALHGFGILGMAGGALLALRAETFARGALRSLAFTSMAVALYLGWIFFYVMQFGWQIIYVRSFDSRQLLTSSIAAGRSVAPLLSLDGWAQVSMIGLLAGVPLLALALVRNSSRATVSVGLFALPGLLFLLRWWPAIFPMNWDLLMVMLPGVWAACWALSASRARSYAAVLVCVAMHFLLWSSVGNMWFYSELVE